MYCEVNPSFWTTMHRMFGDLFPSTDEYAKNLSNIMILQAVTVK